MKKQQRRICLLCFFLLGAALCIPCDSAAATEITFTFGGDCVLGTREAWRGELQAFDSVIDQNGYGWSFEKIKNVFEQDDLSLVNLECVLQDTSRGEDGKKQYRFRGDPAYTRILQEAGIEKVNIANNHYIDYGTRGQKATRAALQSGDIAYSGYGSLYVFEKDGIRVGFGGCRETVYIKRPSTVANEIRKLKKMGCDVIIYSFHWGKEYSPTHSRLQESMAKYAAKYGADIIIGAHPHCVQGIASQDGAVVLYSLGNLVFGGTHEMTTFDAVVARATLRFGESGYEGVEINLLPVLTSGSIPQNDFQPVWAEGADWERIMQLIQDDSSIPVAETMWFPAAV